MPKVLGIIVSLVILGLIIQPVFATSDQFNITNFLQGIFNSPQIKNWNVPNDSILPDLTVSEPKELYITVDKDIKKIRFSTTVINTGEGSVEFIGKSDPDKKITQATQVIPQKDGQNTNKEIGEFVFHPDHDHWHIEDFSQFQLWSIKEDNQFDQMLTSTNKMSFCLWDELPLDPKRGAEDRKYHPTCEQEVQGLSTGWTDTYASYREGQELDISQIPGGKYAIQTVINPDRKIVESNYDNNKAIIYVEIKGDTIRKI